MYVQVSQEAGAVELQNELQEYVAALSRPYSKRTKAELVASLLEAVQLHRDSPQQQGQEHQGRKQPPRRRVAGVVATGELEVGKQAAY